jgi:hypothetical protein
MVEGQVVAIDLRSRRYLAVEGSGAVLWSSLAAGSSAPDLAASLVERFGIDLVTAERDVVALLADLDARGLLEPAP